VAPVANWAATGPLTKDGPLAYYDTYYEYVVKAIGNTCDGYAIHTYALHTEGKDPTGLL